jgi:hypothetical protein
MRRKEFLPLKVLVVQMQESQQEQVLVATLQSKMVKKPPQAQFMPRIELTTE